MEIETEEYYTSSTTGIMHRIDPELGKIEKAKELLSKIYPVKFKEVTGRDLFKK